MLASEDLSEWGGEAEERAGSHPGKNPKLSSLLPFDSQGLPGARWGHRAPSSCLAYCQAPKTKHFQATERPRLSDFPSIFTTSLQ